MYRRQFSTRSELNFSFTSAWTPTPCSKITTARQTSAFRDLLYGAKLQILTARARPAAPDRLPVDPSPAPESEDH